MGELVVFAAFLCLLPLYIEYIWVLDFWVDKLSNLKAAPWSVGNMR